MKKKCNNKKKKKKKRYSLPYKVNTRVAKRGQLRQVGEARTLITETVLGAFNQTVGL